MSASILLTESASTISAVGNDISYQEVFAEQLRAFAEPGDVVIGFSTSGSSPNVLRALEFGNEVGAVSIGVTGRNGHQLAAVARHTLFVNSTSVQHIEDATMVVGHLMCLRVKDLVASATEDSGASVSEQERAVLLRSLKKTPVPAESTTVPAPVRVRSAAQLA